ncbi:dihydrolipoyl dehydrogenase [Piscibacillus halophilus]|uniref:Dihydrolipoyl dehydrogenase n=1 Tax=Piscibacillus halophilus TaxID=571933 RepID=A0A1H9JQB8_9BACI|nr:dihydrolipoyl dehydrogenase [Piscibacillus halophilus]SEQ89052.1 dihydrolipoamide dehydrogenase [Piscibacillus halophilus]
MVVGEMIEERDLVIIGGGPGGYTAAIRAAQLGLNVTLIEKDQLGGICLNQGCIPSKVWAYAARKQSEIPHMKQLGFDMESPKLNLDQLLTYKSNVTEQLRKGVESLCQGNQVEVIQGKATFTSDNKMGVENGHQFDIYQFKKAIIATGCTATLPKSFSHNYERVVLSHDIFRLKELPNHLIVYGSDDISLEVAIDYQSFGSQVTLILPDALTLDPSIEKELMRVFKKKKIKVIKGVNGLSIEETDDQVQLEFTDDQGKERLIEGTHLYTSGMRKPNVEELGLARFGVDQIEDGYIVVNNHAQTSNPNIYAIGDVTAEGPALAVKAIKQGKVAAEAIAGGNPEADLTFLPTIIHTTPPIASVGLTETVAKEHGLEYQIGEFSLKANGFAMLSGQKEGLIKVVSDAKTEIILGIHMIGSGAIELSSSFVQLLEMAAKEEDVHFPNYAHPSMNEGLLEAVEALTGHSIHQIDSKKKPHTSDSLTVKIR